VTSGPEGSIHREILREVDLIGPSRLDFHGQRVIDTHESEAIGPLKVLQASSQSFAPLFPNHHESPQRRRISHTDPFF
jgi:hypothetical protein